jgi:hypothetical protein
MTARTNSTTIHIFIQARFEDFDISDADCKIGSRGKMTPVENKRTRELGEQTNKRTRELGEPKNRRTELLRRHEENNIDNR